MAGCALAALFRSCMDSLKSILTSQEFGANYELLCAELSLQCLRFRLWGASVGMSEESNILPVSFQNRKDLQPTLDQAVGTVKYLLDEVEELRHKYQLKQPGKTEEGSNGKVKPRRSSRSLSALYSLRSTLALRQRIGQNQRQKSFLAIIKWALCDARKFQEKVTKLKSLIDGLENITQAIQPPAISLSAAIRADDDIPPPYSAAEPSSQLSNVTDEQISQRPIQESIGIANNVISYEFSSLLMENNLVMERYLSSWPDDSSAPRPQVRRKLSALTEAQFGELSQDVHDELIRRQRHDFPVPTYLAPDPLFCRQRNAVRERLSTILHFSQLVSDIVFEFERRLRIAGNRVNFYPNPRYHSSNTFEASSRRWGVAYPPPLLRYRATLQPTIIAPELPTLIDAAPSPICSNESQANWPIQVHKHTQDLELNNWKCDDGRLWSMDRVISWLASNNFSNEWQKTFKALDIRGAVFLELRKCSRGGDHTGTMHLLIYPRLAVEYASSGKDWDEAGEREEGKRLRRLLQKVPLQKETRLASQQTPTRSTGSVEIFKSFRVSMEDPTCKVLPAALRKYNINAPWEQYTLYIVYGDNERCLAMDEKPLILFKQLDKEGKKPMFMLRKTISSTLASETTVAAENVPIQFS